MHIKKYLFLLLFACLLPLPVSAGITLNNSPSTVTAGEEIVLNPTISTDLSGAVYVCWGLYYEEACKNEVSGISFRGDLSQSNKNAVRCTMPSVAGTYYIRASLHTGYVCKANEVEHQVTPITVQASEEIATSLESISDKNGDSARKVFIDGKLYLVRGNQVFNAQGGLIR